MRLTFITPAFQRYELTRICLEQRNWAIEKLAGVGVEASSVVIADDDNLDVARSLGHATVERDNEWLGRRFNDGYEWAANNGSTHAFPIGSDSWVDPQFIIDALDRPDAREYDVVASRWYQRVNADGTIRRKLWVPVLQGVSYVIPIAALDDCGHRPCQDELRRGCDGSTWDTVRRRQGVRVVWSEAHELDTVSFESWPQITAFSKLGGRWGRGDVHVGVFSGLTEHYPEDLVAKIQAFYEERRKQPRTRSLEDVEARVLDITHRVIDEGKVPTSVRRYAKPLVQRAVRLALEEE